MKPEQLGPYRIVRPLGRGGMGAVYQGVNVETDESAAIKVLSSTLATEPDFRQRFQVEVETLLKLYHPNIVQLLGYDLDAEVPYYAMEFVDGNSLEEEIQSGRVFQWREVAEMGIQTCRALRHAHDRGVIHRDIKPANLLLTKEGKIKLSDFGIARLFGLTRMTAAGNVLGTVEYMAPEQADARPATPRTDLYSLGGVLYCLLARRPPFRAGSLPEMLEKHRSAQPEPIRRYCADVPAEMELIVSQLLEKDPEKRIANATMVARRLEAMVRALSVTPNTLERQEIERLQRESDAADAEATSAAPIEDLPETRLMTEVPLPSPGRKTPPRAVAELAETAAASAVLVSGQGARPAAPAEEPQGLEKPQPSSGRFVAVAEEDLDRVESAEPEPHPLISLHTWVLAGALLTIGLTAWYLLQAPSADALYARIKAATDDETFKSSLDVQKAIDQFLQRYSDDPRCEQVRRYQREIDLDRLRRKLEREAKGDRSSQELLPIERAYLDAIYESGHDPECGLAKLQALVNLYPREDLSGRVGQCLDLARREVQELRLKVAKINAESQVELKGRLELAEELKRKEPAKAQAIWRAMIELYQEKPWAAEAVQRARSALDAEAAKKETQKQ